MCRRSDWPGGLASGRGGGDLCVGPCEQPLLYLDDNILYHSYVSLQFAHMVTLVWFIMCECEDTHS